MNLVMLCRLYPPYIGGVEKHVSNLAAEAVKDGHRVSIFTLKHDQKLPGEEAVDGVRVYRVNLQIGSTPFPDLLSGKFSGITSRIWERIVLWSWILRNIQVFFQADIIQIHDVFYWYWPIRLLMPWKRAYITYHGFEPSSVKTSAGKGSKLFIDPKAKKTRQMIQRWTQGSMVVGAWIEKWYGTKGDCITYGGANCLVDRKMQQHQVQASKIQNAKSKGIRAVFIGRIAQDTGALVYERVIQKLPHVTLDMYGEGSTFGTIEDACAVLQNYDIACVSSYLAILEAMQSQTLVVAYASDDLKYDYLMAHPRAHDMVIVRTTAALESFLNEYKPEKYVATVDSAFAWARNQTWHRVYLQYKELWHKK